MKTKKSFSLALHLFTIACLHSQASLARDWANYSSENFTIYSDISPKKAADLLRDFEIYRNLVFGTIGLQPRPSHSKMKIMVYNKLSEYSDIAPKNSVGFFTSTYNGPLMAIAINSGGVGGAQVLYHEYIHYILSEHSTLIYPRWYNEGLAEVLGTTTIKSKKAILGEIPKSRTDTIAYYPSFKVRELLSPDPEKMKESIYQGRFYAYAWLFTHYLQISTLRDNPELKDYNRAFLKRYNEGEDVFQAFEASFGMTPEDMDLKLSHYLKKRRLTALSFEFDDFQIEVKTKALSKSQQQFQLADAAWRVGKEEAALDYLKDIDSSSRDAAEAISLLAVLENHKDNTEEAKNKAELALKLAGDNSVVLMNYAHWVNDSRVRAEKNKNDTNELTSKQMDFSNRALIIDPSNLEAFLFLWQAQIAAGEDVEALRTMMRAYELNPSNQNINNVIANHLIRLKSGKLAIPFLERVMNQTHSTESRIKIQELIDSIVSQEKDSSPAI